MAVMNDAERFLYRVKEGTILFEGDRLFYSKFIRIAMSVAESLKLIVLVPKQEEWVMRHRTRNQSLGFLKSRVTKLGNLCREFPFIEVLENTTVRDQSRILDKILTWIG